MDQAGIIYTAMRERELTQAALASKVGLKSQSSVAEILRRKTSVKLDTFVKLLNAMGYDVVVTDRVMGGETRWTVDGPQPDPANEE